MSGVSRLLNDYKVHSLLGAGSFGAVLKCTHRTDLSSYAIKVTLDGDADALREVQNLVKVPGHKNIVQYCICWKDQFNKAELDTLKSFANGQLERLRMPNSGNYLDVICIQMELCGKDLRATLGTKKSVDKGQVNSWMGQLVDGVEHIHKYGIIHRDLKPDNIFMALKDPNVIEIGDLGMATQHRTAHSLKHTRSIGTMIYLAPEQEGRRYGKSVDIFALGIIFLEMLYPEVQPTNHQDDAGPLCDMVFELKHNQRISATVRQNWPIESKLILQMTSVNSDQRPSATEIKTDFLSNSAKSSKPQTNPGQSKTSLSKQLAFLNLQLGTEDRVVHYGVTCNGCVTKDFKGIRWKCTVCDDYDLCESCEKRVGIHPEAHNLTKIKSPVTTQIKSGIEGSTSVSEEPKESGFVHLQSVQPPAIDLDPYEVPKGTMNIRCTHCDKIVPKYSQYYVRGGLIYCVKDYWDLYLPKCVMCGQSCPTEFHFNLYGDSKIPIHIGCFNCTHCGREISPDEPNFTKDGISYCARDYHKLFSPKCAKCGHPCKDKHVELDGSVHYHTDCYNCFYCRVKLTSYLKKESNLVCPNCFKLAS